MQSYIVSIVRTIPTSSYLMLHAAKCHTPHDLMITLLPMYLCVVIVSSHSQDPQDSQDTQDTQDSQDTHRLNYTYISLGVGDNFSKRRTHAAFLCFCVPATGFLGLS
eukprot:scpid112505/ scgid21365/ 